MAALESGAYDKVTLSNTFPSTNLGAGIGCPGTIGVTVWGTICPTPDSD